MKLLLLLISLAFSITCNAQQAGHYKVSVTIKEGIKSGKAFIRYFTDTGPYMDSVNFSNGKFVISGTVPEKLTIATIFIRQAKEYGFKQENSCEWWMETGNIQITCSNKLANADYSGSAVQLQFAEQQKKLLPVKKKSLVLDEAYEKAEAKKDTEAKGKLLNEGYPALFKEKQKILGAFIKKYPASLISAYKLSEFAGDGEMDLATVEPVYDLLDTVLKKHPLVISVAERISINKRTAPGMHAIEFMQTDTSGKPVSLSSFRGKYLLIDFWAGWCAPCRAENPLLIKMYDRYKNKGFEILGVSLDGERKRWTNAIIADKLQWTQVSDLQIFENSIAKQYGITSIPQNILIDTHGIIVAKNLRGRSLEKKLEAIFK